MAAANPRDLKAKIIVQVIRKYKQLYRKSGVGNVWNTLSESEYVLRACK